MNLRLIILEALLLIEKDDLSAGTVIRQLLDKYDYLDKQERSFLKRVLEGTVERRIELDYIIDSRSKVKTAKMKPAIRQIMRMSVYQLKYMDGIPDSAVCNEAVKLAAGKGMSGLKGFVNGVLRTVSRDLDKICYPDESTAQGLSVRCSCPLWLVNMLIQERGIETARAILEESLKRRDLFIRTNLSKTTVDDLVIRLENDGAFCTRSSYLPYALKLSGIDSISRMEAFNDGLFTVQDIGSMLVTEAADIKKNDIVFDVCAAPGGKSMHALDKLSGSGHLYSFDVSDRKLDLIRDNAARIGFDNLDIILSDAAKFREDYLEKADVLIADLPCSGLGVMGRKNDIKYNINEDKLDSLVRLQRDILRNVSRYVKPGGVLIFSTCTIHKAENEDNFNWILNNLPFEAGSLDPYLPDELKCETTRRGCLQLIPGIHDSDGFFISRFVKRG